MTGSLTPDTRTRTYGDGTTIVGGDPPRVLRLTPVGATVACELLAGGAIDTPARSTLAMRLTTAGLAHPRVQRVTADNVTVVIPVRDRPEQLGRCLQALAGAKTIVVDDGSADAEAAANVCAVHGARLVRRAVSGGPAAARNAALTCVDTGLIAFLDSDCIPEPGWLETLSGVIADPAVGAVAPRIRPLGGAGDGPVARYATARSPLDMGPHPARVRPGGRVGYVPTAALLVRRAALGDGFDAALRFGEDVDLVWRIHDAGWIVRYEPAAAVRHAEPSRCSELARRRFGYGSSAGPLARRHPQRLAPVRLAPGPTAAVALAAARRPGLAAAAATVHLVLATHRLTRAGVPLGVAAGLGLGGIRDSTVAIGRATTMLAPGLLVAGLASRRTRPTAATLLLAEPIRNWTRERPDLDPLRWAVMCVADDVAYGAGVWTGAARAHTALPLFPTLTVGLGSTRGRVRLKAFWARQSRFAVYRPKSRANRQRHREAKRGL